MSGFDDMKCRIFKFACRYYDLLFVVVFMVVLIVPVTKFNMASYSKEENRTLAVSRNFGKNFDQWLNDRFRGRQKLIDLYFKFDRRLSKRVKTGRAFLGQNAWLFYSDEYSIDNYQNKTQFSQEQLIRIENNIAYRQYLLRKNNIDYFVFIAPDKNRIYGENYPEYIHKIREYGRAEQLVKYIKQSKNHIDICYPMNALLDEKGKNVVYYRFDTHWNDLGAFVGYYELMNNIKVSIPNLRFFTYDDISIDQREETTGDLMNMLQISRQDISKNSVYTTFVRPKSAYTFQYRQNEGTKGVETVNTKSLNNLKVLFLRDSFSSAWTPYMAQTFAHVKMIWSQDFNANYSVIMEFKPDIVIQEVVERNCTSLLTDIPVVKEEK